ncbi:MAG: iron ABC transporter permease, partial [Rhodospirillaceae bacterium]
FVVCVLPILLGFAIPLFVLAAYSIKEGDQLLGGFAGFALNSIGVAAVAAVIATALALVLAYAQRLSESALTKGAIRLSTLGYALPGTLLAVALLGPIGGLDRSLTAFLGDTLNWSGGLVLTGTVALLIYAYVVRFLTVSFNAVSGSLSGVSPYMDAAARSLGATPREVVRRVHLPLIAPGVSAAALLVFVDVMRELPATLILRPFNFETLATRVYRLASDERLAEASTAAVAIVLVGLVPVILLYKLGQTERPGGPVVSTD